MLGAAIALAAFWLPAAGAGYLKMTMADLFLSTVIIGGQTTIAELGSVSKTEEKFRKSAVYVELAHPD